MKKIKIFLSLLLTCIFIMGSTVINVNAAEKTADNLKITVNNCNVRVEFSANEKYSCDFDSSKFIVNTTINDSTFEIEVSKIAEAKVNCNDIITINIPNQTYDLVTVISNQGGLTLPPVNADITVTSNAGAVIVNLPSNYTKTVNYTGTKSSGALNLNDNSNFTINAKFDKCAVGVPNNWSSYSNGNSGYYYTSGTGTAVFNMDLTNCSFVFTNKKDSSKELSFLSL